MDLIVPEISAFEKADYHPNIRVMFQKNAVVDGEIMCRIAKTVTRELKVSNGGLSEECLCYMDAASAQVANVRFQSADVIRGGGYLGGVTKFYEIILHG